MRGFLEAIGTALLLLAASFVGLLRLLAYPDRFGRRQVVGAVWRGALLPLPLCGLLAALLGATIAVALGNGYALAPIEELLLPVLRNALLRHTVPLYVGLLALGQAGLGLTIRLAAMETSGEADTLRSLGIAPAQWVLPASLLEFLVFGTVQYVCAAGVAQLAAVLVLQVKFGLPPAHYADLLAGPAGRGDLWSGAARSSAFVLLVWLIAATAGILVADGPDRLARATRATFVVALLAMLVTGYLFTTLGD